MVDRAFEVRQVALDCPGGGEEDESDPSDGLAGGSANRERVGRSLIAIETEAPVELVGREVAELPVAGNERELGGGMVGHRGEDARLGCQRPANGRHDDRGGHRPTVLSSQPSAAEQLGQVVVREERDCGDPGPTSSVRSAIGRS